MAVEKKPKMHTSDIGNQISSINSVIAPTPVQETDPKKDAKKDSTLVAVRLSEAEKRSLKSFFDANGITLSGGMLKCAKYVMEEVNLGNLRVSADGGIKSRRLKYYSLYLLHFKADRNCTTFLLYNNTINEVILNGKEKK